MSLLPDRLFSGDWVRDARLRRLPRHVQFLLLFLRHICDRNGRFEYDPVDVHRLLYASVEDNVSARDVEAWLELLRSGGYVRAYIGVEGRRVGEISHDYWKQRLKHGRERFDPEPEDPGLPIEAPPQAPPGREEKRSEVNRAAKARAVTHDDSVDGRVAELQTRWPEHDVPAAIKRARKYVRDRNGPDAPVTVVWFERHWMPNEPKRRLAEVVEFLPEPSRFVEWFKARYEKAPEKTWAEMTPEARAYYLLQMRQSGAA